MPYKAVSPIELVLQHSLHAMILLYYSIATWLSITKNGVSRSRWHALQLHQLFWFVQFNFALIFS